MDGLSLIISNPPKSTKRRRGRKVRSSRKRNVVRRNPGGSTVARKKSRKRRRSSGVARVARRVRVSVRRSVRRRRRGGGGVGGLLGRKLGGFVSTDLLMGGALGLAGYIGVNYAMSWVPTTWIDSDMKRIGIKLGVSLVSATVVGALLKKPRLGASLALGGLIAAGVDFARTKEWPGVSGLGEWGIGAVPSFDARQLPSNGLGCMQLTNSSGSFARQSY
jgi:hypothetical protein